MVRPGKKTKVRLGNLTIADFALLKTGHRFGGTTLETEQEQRAAWEKYGEKITNDFIAAKPGRRPYGWWKWGPGRGLQFRYRNEWTGESLPPPPTGAMYYGAPRLRNQQTDCYMWESEASVLDRNGLLTAAERRILHCEEPTTNEKDEPEPPI
jgi:hypothetical protein